MTDSTTNRSRPRVGWIGTGRMGVAMAARLADAGMDVTAWNRTIAKAEPLKEHGASLAGLRDRDVVFTTVSTSSVLEQVLSGPRETYDQVAHLLQSLGRSVTYVGEGDNARLVKIAHNLMLGVVTQALAEITVLAEKSGVPRHAFLAFLNDSVMGSAFTRYKSPAFVHLHYTPTFTPPLLRKASGLGLAARALDVPMPVTALTAQLVQASVGTGRLDEDFAILLDLQAAASGLDLKPEDVAVNDGLGNRS